MRKYLNELIPISFWKQEFVFMAVLLAWLAVLMLGGWWSKERESAVRPTNCRVDLGGGSLDV